MIRSAKIESFGPITHLACDEFGKINLLIGPNGSGKTTLLKSLYAAIKCIEQDGRGNELRKLNELLVNKLYWTFQCRQIGELVHKGADTLRFEMTSTKDETLSYSFGQSTARKISNYATTYGRRSQNSIFIPAKEVLSLKAIIEESRSDKFNAFGFDDTYYDLAKALQPRTKGKNIKSFAAARTQLTDAINGRIEYDKNRAEWLFCDNSRQTFSIAITSEGVKKLSVLDVLLGNHYLSKDSVIFIDEPESALHPRLISVFMDIIANIANDGIQFFIATHSYFVVKKLYLIAQKRGMSMPVISFGADGTTDHSDLREGMADNPIIDESITLYREELTL